MATTMNINKASKEELMKRNDELGNELVERIENFIQEKGGINIIEELKELSNIGEQRISHFKESFTVE